MLVLLLADLYYSFLQHLSMPLDGDFAGGVVPEVGVKTILNDPFGISVITKNAFYPNPNRFFAHWSFYNFFNTVPICLQRFVSPIQSIYLASALLKIVLQFSIITLLSIYIRGTIKLRNLDFAIIALILTPLFQTNGYRSYMGIIDPSITYTFFYALPCGLALLFFLPFYLDSYHGIKIYNNKIILIVLFFYSFFIALNGPLIPGVILIVWLLYILYFCKKTYGLNNNASLKVTVLKTIKTVPKTYFFFFILTCLLSLYSLFIGRNNSIFIGETVSITERYSRIPFGLYSIVAQKIGFPLLIIAIITNIFLIKKYFINNETKKLLIFFKWIGLFSLLYIALLPLGGYKDYRPNIVRYDTIMPITIALMFIYGASTFQLINYFKGGRKNLYLGSLIAFSIIYTLADKPEFNKNECEILALEKIANSNENIILIESNCTVLAWKKILDPKESTLNGELLKSTRITKTKKLFYQKE